MGFFDKWFAKPQTLVVEPVSPQKYDAPVALDLRQGSWVKTPAGRIGILTNASEYAEVTLTDGSGFNIMELGPNNVGIPVTIQYPLHQLKRATISEIPVARYESVEQLRALGYGD